MSIKDRLCNHCGGLVVDLREGHYKSIWESQELYHIHCWDEHIKGRRPSNRATGHAPRRREDKSWRASE